MTMGMALQCLYAFLGCVGFCFVFNIRGWGLLLTSLGGTIGWAVYLLFTPLQNDIVQYFIATLAISAYSEIMARVRKSPVTGYLLVALLPMVPGSGIYYTMQYCVLGNTEMFLQTLLHTLGIAGSLALGILMVSSFVNLIHIIRTSRIKIK
jgi:uncharacterized membrane protein YjjB (DUF3815 family)